MESRKPLAALGQLRVSVISGWIVESGLTFLLFLYNKLCLRYWPQLNKRNKSNDLCARTCFYMINISCRFVFNPRFYVTQTKKYASAVFQPTWTFIYRSIVVMNQTQWVGEFIHVRSLTHILLYTWHCLIVF